MRQLLLMISIITSLVSNSRAHIGDRIIPIFEIPDELLTDIDLKDGSIDDWLEVVGEPTLTTYDFFDNPTISRDGYDPADFDYRVWLSWNRSTNRLYMAAELVDDIFLNEYKGINDDYSMSGHDGTVVLAVDSDHSGGEFYFNPDCCDEEEEWLSILYQQAQQYTAGSKSPDGRHVILEPNNFLGLSHWATLPPYADGGGITVGENPAISIIEFYVTPFDRFIWNNPVESKISELSPGNVVGFRIVLMDNDIETHTVDGFRSFPTFDLGRAHELADAVLVGAGGTVPKDTAVQSTSWARIKSSFRSR